ncbi:MAG: type IV secretory system conjugative DNA transfer family protein [Ruminiclostridium sp.]|nr:type IV secretory system conjugative DNA transfer family protein [Ruminiclostridium sp.]
MMTNENTGTVRIAQGCSYSLDDLRTGINNNILAVGSSGTGKTRSLVIPALHEAVGSYFIVDPKGLLYRSFAPYLESKGYVTKLINFADPAHSDGYNPMECIHSTQDIIKLAELITDSKQTVGTDPFWDQNEMIYLCALTGYLYETRIMPMNISSILKLNNEGERDGEYDKSSKLRRRFHEHKRKNPDSWACMKFDEVDVTPYKTYDCIRSTLSGKFSKLDTKELRTMMRKGRLSFTDAATRKTAVFVTISDTDRSMDMLANLFFSQALNSLCDYADKECGGRLPIPVRLILDDFATNVTIREFPRMIASIRSRGISTMLLIQAESQLEQNYKQDARTIISNCDTYVYLGTNDLNTAEAISKRCDRELWDVLYMPRGRCWVFRSGDQPVNAKLVDPVPLIEEMKDSVKKEYTEELPA